MSNPCILIGCDFRSVTLHLERDIARIIGHFGRLDPASFEARFGRQASPGFVQGYVETVARLGSTVLGAEVDKELRGIAELRGLLSNAGPDAEAALSIERHFQGRGLGTALMQAAIDTARRLSFTSIFVCCDRANWRMERIMRSLKAEIVSEEPHLLAQTAFERGLDARQSVAGHMPAPVVWRARTDREGTSKNINASLGGRYAD